MFEGARAAALGTGPATFPADPHADLGDTEPWELLYTTLNLPALASDATAIASDTA